MGYDPCSLNEIVFAKELMEKWGVGPNELQQYIDNGLVAYYFAPGKKPKIKLKSYSCGHIGIRSKNLPQEQEETDGFNHWVISWDRVVFDAEKVKAFEVSNPTLVNYATNQELSTSAEGFLCLKDVLLSEEILNRWPGMESWELAEKIDNKIKEKQEDKFPTPYWMRKHKVNPTTKEHIYFCEQIDTIHPYSEHYHGNDMLYDFEMIALDMQEALQWEKGKDWLFFIDPDQLSKTGGTIATENTDVNNVESAHNYFLTAEDIYRRWSVSPARLVEIIRSNGDLPVYWRQINVPF